METEAIEVLLVEDNPSDQELTLRLLRKEGLANRIQVANDGEEALDFIFCRNGHGQRTFDTPPG